MGLDHWLHKKVYIRNWSYKDPELQFKVEVKRGENILDMPDIQQLEINVVDWRKENHIHAWFVEHVQSGNDDCREYYVSQESLTEFVDTCKKILKEVTYTKRSVPVTKMEEGSISTVQEDVEFLSPQSQKVAEELMPTRSGFFFGDTQYSKYYVESLEEAIEKIEFALKRDEDENLDTSYYYGSSW